MERRQGRVTRIDPLTNRIIEEHMPDDGSTYILRFDGRPERVSAETLGISLIHIAALIKEVNAELGAPYPLEIDVEAHAPGSFEVHLALSPEARGLLAFAATEGLAAIKQGIEYVVAVVTGILTIKKAFGGEPPKPQQTLPTMDGPSIALTDSHGNVFNVDQRTYNIYMSSDKVRDEATGAFQAVSRDPSVTGVELLDARRVPLFSATRDDFPALAAAPPSAGEIAPEGERVRIETTVLPVLKPSFDARYKWEVVYNGNRVFVAMADEVFLERLASRQIGFYAGDRLEAELAVRERFDPNVKVWIHTNNYTVVRVIRRIETPDQMPLLQAPDKPPPVTGEI